MGTEDAIVFTTGHPANVGTLGTVVVPGDTVIADSGDHASILDGCLLSRAKLRPFRHNRLTSSSGRSTARGGDGGGVLVVVDGVFSMEGDVARSSRSPRCARRTAHGSWSTSPRAACWAPAARGRASCSASRTGVDLRMGTFSKSLASCGGFVAGPAEVDGVPAHPVAGLPLHRLGVPAAIGAALAALRVVRSADGPRAAGRRARGRPLPPRRAPRERGFAVGQPQPLPDGSDIVTPIVPAPGGRRLAAPALLWRALYDAGVFVNTALHPAVPPGGALLRTSVMATHDPRDLDRALDAFSTVKAAFEAEHGPLPQHPLS